MKTVKVKIDLNSIEKNIFVHESLIANGKVYVPSNNIENKLSYKYVEKIKCPYCNELTDSYLENCQWCNEKFIRKHETLKKAIKWIKKLIKLWNGIQ